MSESVTMRSTSRTPPWGSSSTAPGRRSANVDPMNVMSSGSSLALTAARAVEPNRASGTGSGVTNQ
jgi:hypothetical protein